MSVDRGAQVVSDGVALTQANYGAFVLQTAFLGKNTQAMAVLADGTVLLGTARELVFQSASRARLGAAAICACPDRDAGAMLVGTDDGRLLRITADRGPATVWTGRTRWVEQIARFAPGGPIAVAQGRAVSVLDPDGVALATFEDHPSTATGLAFSPDGGQVAVSHYDGVSVWDLKTKSKAHALSWHGSHTGLAWSPDGRYLVSVMQDRELHCWRLPEGKGMRMSGYPSKIRAISWTADSAFIVAGGADTVTSWYVAEGGPAERAPLEFGYVFNGTVSQVAAHPTARCAAGGYDEGTVLIGAIESGNAIIARPAGDGAVTCLAWSANGGALLAGTERGAVAVIELKRAVV